MLRRNASPSAIPKMKLEEVVGGLGARLSGEDEHGISGDGDGEIAAGRRRITMTFLRHFLPMRRARRQGNSPHVVETRIAVVTGENPQLGVVHTRTVSGASNRNSAFKLPFHPLS